MDVSGLNLPVTSDIDRCAEDLYKRHCRLFGCVNASEFMLWLSAVMGVVCIGCCLWLLAVIIAAVLLHVSLGIEGVNGGVLISMPVTWFLFYLLGMWESWLKRRYRRVAEVINVLERVT